MNLSPETAHAIATVIGLFVLSMVAMSILYYGWDTIIVMVIGLFAIAAVIRAMTGG